MADTDKEFSMIIFYIEKGILSSYEVSELLAIQIPLDAKIRDGTVSRAELAVGIKTELNLFLKCKSKVQCEYCSDTELPVFTLLCKRIIKLFEDMHKNYTIVDMLDLILSFCLDNAVYLIGENLKFLLEAVNQTKNNQAVWIKLITLYAEMELHDEIFDIILEAVKYSESNFMEIWEKIIQCIKQKYPKSIVPTFIAGTKLPYENIAEEIRYQYFVWFLGSTSEIISIRSLFEELKDLNPPSIRLYELMISTETSRKNSRLITIRQLFTEACKKFGTQNISIWAKRIHFEFSTKNPSLARKIMSEALKCLDSVHKESMLDEIERISSEFKQPVSRDEFMETDD